MADQPAEHQATEQRTKPSRCLYDGPALKVPPGVRIRPKKFARFDDPVIPRRYWYLTLGLTGAAFVFGLVLGRLILL